MKTTYQLKCGEKIMILPFFLPKMHMASKLQQNDVVIVFINRQQ